ncbi:TonB-dependent receptor domain-containing protein [Pigmentiphaga sp.]|uniref:TonB-dependent receptor domain-containing protein n=1 Tax=Pigmentiphaga sp. TaxID=1977564 RepID=UPI0029CA235D|nr:TonB-dependent receptor [Pigmentiphaga sp.]
MSISWAGVPAAGWAQAAPGSEPAPQQLQEITVSATPLSRGEQDLAAPVTVLDEEDLLTTRRATLGETLEHEPGITSSHFGAGASRPIIRGMDAARVKVLSDGAEVQDASTISPDHAVGLEPMLSHRVEVLRGPAALLYGGGAVGGVVNVLDNKIPTAVPEDGVEGSVELRGATAPRETTGAFELTTGGKGFALHAEGLKRGASDYKVGRGWAGGDRVDGSYNHTETGSVGLSWIGDRGYIGLAYTSQHNRYGLPGHDHSYEGCHTHGAHLHCPDDGHDHGQEGHAEDEHDHDHDHEEHGVPFVKLRSQRWDVRGELQDPFAGFSRLRVRAGLTDYQHDEIEGGTVATTFRNKAHDGRVELEHAPIGGLRGVIGAQTTRRDFSALGEEAYVQPTITRNHGLFAVEEYTVGDWRFEGGLRHEWQRIDAQGGSPDSKHRGTSVSAGAVWKFAPQYSVGLSASRSQRLPTAEELYADGLHLATATYEVGNANLKKETSNNVDLTLRKFAGPTTFSVSVFHNKVDNFIYGRTLDVYENLQLLEYSQHDATFTGLEAKVRHQLNKVFAVSLMGDYVRAKLDGGAGNLPRIPAHRVGARLDARWQAWSGDVELSYVGRQNKVAEFETETAGYAMLNLGAAYEGRVSGSRYQIYVRANNLTNKLAYRHTSFIKNAAPLMGRSIVMGVRLTF